MKGSSVYCHYQLDIALFSRAALGVGGRND
jgi:hypothetical protein